MSNAKQVTGALEAHEYSLVVGSRVVIVGCRQAGIAGTLDGRCGSQFRMIDSDGLSWMVEGRNLELA